LVELPSPSLDAGSLLVLERGEDAFSHGVVPAVALAAHARQEAARRDHPAEIAAGVLAAAIRVEPDVVANRIGRPGVEEGLLHEVVGQSGRLGCSRALGGSDNGGQIPPYPGRHRAVDGKPAIQHVVGHRTRRTAVGGTRSEAALGLAAQSFLAHQPGHPLVSDGMGAGPQRPHQPRASVGESAVGVDRTQVRPDRRVGIGLVERLPMQVVAGDRYPQHPAQQPNREKSPLTSDEGVPHLDSLATNAVAFLGSRAPS